MRSLLGVFRLLHPINGMSSSIAVIVGYLSTSRFHTTPLNGVDLLLSSIIVFCVTSAGFIINDIVDVDIDRVNRPNRPIAAGIVPIQNAILVYLLLLSISIIFSLFLTSNIMKLVIFVNLSLLIYSLWMKQKLITGHVIIALNGSILLVFGGLAAGSIIPMVYTIPAIFFAFFAREVLKTIPDEEGDKLHGIKNITTTYGVQSAAHVSKIAFVLSYVLYIPLSFVFNTTFLVISVLLGMPLLIFLISRLNPVGPLEFVVFISKMVFIFFLFPIFFGT